MIEISGYRPCDIVLRELALRISATKFATAKTLTQTAAPTAAGVKPKSGE